eukprot:CAMPEP_0117039770 /NCGR_PEP_ID=MMETSP0472-20121206/27885_1 /TAXON_ID=693140 ORGANISM="Tiarina fusus, Strain LIS" /NCGR_SAMPLE_ID=MMETSP0472 /ASSEMBLY_ACC=CAM_ASM_000603 /LENGTH=620 /DNA_ID=CAMNT_0004750341 /DNA_START=147 /DNA_END=2009 /DNA_ORIENTATION=+
MTKNSDIQSPSPSCCVVCDQPNIDLRSITCPCTFHAKCALPRLLLSEEERQATAASSYPSCCSTGTCCSGFRLEPLSFDDLETAIDVRSTKEEKQRMAAANGNDDNKAGDSSNASKTRAAVAVYFPQGGKGDEDSLRTGRWTKQEVQFMDFLETAFDQGTLPIPNGSKLSTFLGDILLCRSSRLTKKRKRAKLSIRSFELNKRSVVVKEGEEEGGAKNNKDFAESCKILFALQEKFLSILPSESSKMELRFNLSKQWRTYVSELCVQIGYSRLDVRGWIASLEELEERVATTEENMRSLQRRQLRGSFQQQLSSPRVVESPAPPPPPPQEVGSSNCRILTDSPPPSSSPSANLVTRNTMVSPASSCASPEELADDQFDVDSSSSSVSVSSEDTAKRTREHSSMDGADEHNNNKGAPPKRPRLWIEEEFAKDTWSSLELFAADLEEDPIAFLPTTNAAAAAADDEFSSSLHPETSSWDKEGASVQRMIHILGNELMNQAPTMDPYSSIEQGGMTSQIMTLRLLLLTHPSRRTPEDNELIQILTRSFEAHSNSRRHGRSQSDIANLLTKEFSMLKMSFMSTPPPPTRTLKTTLRSAPTLPFPRKAAQPKQQVHQSPVSVMSS